MSDIVISLQQNVIKKTRDVEEGGATNNDDDEYSLVGEKRKGKEVETLETFPRKGVLALMPLLTTYFRKI